MNALSENLSSDPAAAGPKPFLAAVVVTFDRLDKLKVTVARLLAEKPQDLAALVVVDNASTDGTGAWLAGLSDPRLDVVTLPDNRGGAGGFAAGIARAAEAVDPDWIVVMDDDARPLPGALAAFRTAPRAVTEACAAAVYFPDGRICEMNRPSQNPFWSLKRFVATLRKGRDGFHIPRSDFDTGRRRPLDMTSFVGFFLSREMVAKAGLPEAGLFLYGDDVIYTLGLRRMGFTIAFDPTVRFEHDCSTYENDDVRVVRPLWKAYYIYRNSLIMYHDASGVLFWPLLVLVALKWHLSARRYGEDRSVYLRLMRRGLVDGVRRRTGMSLAEVKALADG
ncbi:glycosyltransferase [Chachezhania sediminis]|uniref:glycosyltransferase n=1 Tax=Chachezhania sediminis TaxID=2599291 RepID=UPI001E2909B6|nr:glycosyltransferase [Chachezhania sediminis]